MQFLSLHCFAYLKWLKNRNRTFSKSYCGFHFYTLMHSVKKPTLEIFLKRVPDFLVKVKNGRKICCLLWKLMKLKPNPNSVNAVILCFSQKLFIVRVPQDCRVCKQITSIVMTGLLLISSVNVDLYHRWRRVHLQQIQCKFIVKLVWTTCQGQLWVSFSAPTSHIAS